MSEIGSQPRIAADGARGTVHAVHYNLSYIAKGQIDPAAPVVVLLHSFPGDATVWQKVLPSLKVPSMAFDLLGFGQSEHPWPADTSIWGHADVLNLALRALDLRKVILVGYGLGGGVAQVLATRLMPERTTGLVLIDSIAYQYAYHPNWPLPEMEKRRDPEAPRHTSLADIEAALRQTIPQGSATPSSISGTTLDMYVKPWLNELDKEIFFQQILRLEPYYMNAVASDLAHLACPTLIIWGEKDTIMPVQLGKRLHQQIPGSELIMIPNAGHLILNDAPDQVAQPVGDFINRIGKR